MDEVITCECGCQAWVIGTSGTRCSKCAVWLRQGDVQADIAEINQVIAEGRMVRYLSHE